MSRKSDLVCSPGFFANNANGDEKTEASYQKNGLLKAVAERRMQEISIINLSAKEILLKSDVMDYSRRYFENISPIQYAFWAHDFLMLKMLFRGIPENHLQEACQQLIDLQKHGITYRSFDIRIADMVSKTEVHYDFPKLLDIYECFIKNYKEEEHEANKLYICTTIGREQRMVPVYVANTICNPSYLNKDELPCTFKICRHLQELEIVDWYPLTANQDLGVEYAIMSAPQRDAASAFYSFDVKIVKKDFLLLKSLYETNLAKLEQFMMILDESVPSPSTCSM